MKSSLSFSHGNCVDVVRYAPSELESTRERYPAGTVVVTHSTAPDGLRLLFTPDEWEAFIAGVKNGEFDLIMLPFGLPGTPARKS